MSSAGGQAVGRTLAKLAALAPRPGRQASETPAESRQQIRQLILEADKPVGVEFLCAETGLHANTIRGHLEVLLAAGDVHREPGTSPGRGRPPWLYSAGSAKTPLYEELVSSLVEQLGSATDASLISAAAARWAEVAESRGATESPDDAVSQVADSLTQLGFHVEVGPIGDQITLGSCPYLALVADEPAICDIHTGLLRELLSRTNQPIQVEAMEVLPRPGMCLARLDRPDLEPIRVITPATDPQPTSTPSANDRKRKRTQ